MASKLTKEQRVIFFNTWDGKYFIGSNNLFSKENDLKINKRRKTQE
jgi:hypothetical protein